MRLLIKITTKMPFIFDEFHCFYLTQMNKFKINSKSNFPAVIFNQKNIKLSLSVDVSDEISH
jgi:hypothetical protein